MMEPSLRNWEINKWVLLALLPPTQQISLGDLKARVKTQIPSPLIVRLGLEGANFYAILRSLEKAGLITMTERRGIPPTKSVQKTAVAQDILAELGGLASILLDRSGPPPSPSRLPPKMAESSSSNSDGAPAPEVGSALFSLEALIEDYFFPGQTTLSPPTQAFVSTFAQKLYRLGHRDPEDRESGLRDALHRAAKERHLKFSAMQLEEMIIAFTRIIAKN